MVSLTPQRSSIDPSALLLCLILNAGITVSEASYSYARQAQEISAAERLHAVLESPSLHLPIAPGDIDPSSTLPDPSDAAGNGGLTLIHTNDFAIDPTSNSSGVCYPDCGISIVDISVTSSLPSSVSSNHDGDAEKHHPSSTAVDKPILSTTEPENSTSDLAPYDDSSLPKRNIGTFLNQLVNGNVIATVVWTYNVPYLNQPRRVHLRFNALPEPIIPNLNPYTALVRRAALVYTMRQVEIMVRESLAEALRDHPGQQAGWSRPALIAHDPNGWQLAVRPVRNRLIPCQVMIELVTLVMREAMLAALGRFEVTIWMEYPPIHGYTRPRLLLGWVHAHQDQDVVESLANAEYLANSVGINNGGRPGVPASGSYPDLNIDEVEMPEIVEHLEL